MSEHSNKPDILDRLDILTTQYAEKLPGRLQEIRETFRHYSQPESNHEELLIEIHHQVHALAGTTGTFGYKQVSQRLRELETYLVILSESTPVVIDDACANKIREQLAAVDAEISRLQRNN